MNDDMHLRNNSTIFTDYLSMRGKTLKIRRWHMLISSLIIVLAVALTLGVGMLHIQSTHAAAVPSSLHTVVPYKSSGYLYRVVQTGADQGFEAPTYNPKGFKAGKAAFGTGGGCPLDSTVNTPWASNTDILVRKTIDLPTGGTGLKVYVAIDNDAIVYWNGVQIGSVVDDGCATRNTLVASVPSSAVVVGKNLLAIRGTDRGSETYLDVLVTAA
jgi:hypothetical protein